jgi:hypothetical protein
MKNLNENQIKFEINFLLYAINSRYGIFDNIHPTIDEQKEMFMKIINLREQLKNLKINKDEKFK